MSKLYKDLAEIYELIIEGSGGIRHKLEANFVKTMVKKKIGSTTQKLKLLNVGCGHGWHDQYLKSHFEVTGIDLNQELLNLASKRNPTVTYLLGDMRNFYLGKKFDVVISFDTLLYNLNCDDLKTSLKNLTYHLKDKGILIFHLDRLKENFTNHEIYTQKQYFIRNKHVTFTHLNYDKNTKDTIYQACLVFLVSEKGKELTHEVLKESLGLFELNDIIRIISDLGLNSSLFSHDGLGRKYSVDHCKYPMFVCTPKHN